MRRALKPLVLSWIMSFLSIQAQDFIEEGELEDYTDVDGGRFLSIQAQDFIEDMQGLAILSVWVMTFLSIQAQDFIEERRTGRMATCSSYS